MIAVPLQVKSQQHLIDNLVHLIMWDTQIFESKGDFALDGGRNDLVLRILEDHPNQASNLIQIHRVPGIEAIHQDIAARWQQQTVQAPGQGRFPATVCSHKTNTLAILESEINLAQDIRFRFVSCWVVEGEI